MSRRSLLDPRSTWRDPAAYDAKARELAGMFTRELREVRRREAPATAVAAARARGDDRGGDEPVA